MRSEQDIIRNIREAIARSLEVLRASATADTFLGRRTHDPFPTGRDEAGGHGDDYMAQWIASKELQPPK